MGQVLEELKWKSFCYKEKTEIYRQNHYDRYKHLHHVFEEVRTILIKNDFRVSFVVQVIRAQLRNSTNDIEIKHCSKIKKSEKHKRLHKLLKNDRYFEMQISVHINNLLELEKHFDE